MKLCNRGDGDSIRQSDEFLRIRTTQLSSMSQVNLSHQLRIGHHSHEVTEMLYGGTKDGRWDEVTWKRPPVRR